MSLRIYGNRLIQTLPGEATRPTLAKVRQAVFNIWQGTIDQCRWLDLCAGSGSMGAEALCRGAAIVTGIDQSYPACQLIRQNWQQVAQPTQQFQVQQGDVLKQLQGLSGQQFDRIYFDPPYDSGLYKPVLMAIVAHKLLAIGAELAVEHRPRLVIPLPPELIVCREKTYGRSALTFYASQPINFV